MGRGRAKAKQARIARELKYFSPPTDLTALQHELAGVPHAVDDDPDEAYTDYEREEAPSR
ncbi:DUF3073 domain-containing protein [Dactylosporangium sp. NPDC051485]|uniref:DUF3073 domain-containing protein n=1 Tax=Dactylosporangium sp. NPDC051485 TaxID=3154846 RepID=UPI003441F862